LSVSESTARRYELLDPDVRLMLQVRDDHAPAFEELVQRYQNRLIAVLEHLVRDRQRAEDLAQETFLRVFRARKSYRPGARFSTWLFTIANNVASNSLRDAARRREAPAAGNGAARSGVGEREAPRHESFLEQAAMAPSGMMPVRRVERAERAEIVRLAMESLGERQRMALLLSKFEGMSYAEIAETMQLSVKAVKSLLSRARVSLKILLEPYMNDGGSLAPEAAAVAAADEAVFENDSEAAP
jgi:RNA polymerase sigma-70 factor (ECF subfamily)